MEISLMKIYFGHPILRLQEVWYSVNIHEPKLVWVYIIVEVFEVEYRP